MSNTVDINMLGYVTNKLHAIRKERNITQEFLANEIGITRQTIIAIEKGNYTPSVFLALKIAEYFNKKVEDIFTLT